MTREEYCAKIGEAIDAFQPEGTCLSCTSYGHGHINDTFLLTFQNGEKETYYILQRINHEIFRRPDQLMENITGVTSFLKEKIIQCGGDPNRETLNIIPTRDGMPYYQDSIGSYWRVYVFITDAVSLEKVEKLEDFYQSAVAFGKFQNLLSDYPAASLHETISDFHNTPWRFQNFLHAVNQDAVGRADSVREEIQFFLDREAFTHVLIDQQKEGSLPLRVTHNDTKLNNIMLDNKTGKGICVIDLDTVMPGFSVTDFGDSIRFGASTAAEDETDLSKVNLDLKLYELFTKGFLQGFGDSLTQTEIELLPCGAKMMTLECGMRFLTDYLEGDKYFRIHRRCHNLDRTHTQIKLVTDMETHWDAMHNIIHRYV